MATIGTAYTTPEAGWTRIDDRDPIVTYSVGVIKNYNWATAYKGAYSYWQNSAQTVRFSFTGTVFRIGGRSNAVYSQNINVKIDGVPVGSYKQYYGSDIVQCLFYESPILPRGTHNVELSGNFGVIDFIETADFIKSKLFILNNLEYYYHDNTSWISLGFSPTIEQIETYGMDTINATKISEFETLYGTNWEAVQWSKDIGTTSSTLNATPFDQVITANNSISLNGLVSASFAWTATGGSRIALSVDEGLSYHAFKNGLWVDVTTDISQGMTATEYSALTWDDFSILKGDSNILKHKYYIPDNSTVDDITIRANLMGSNKIASGLDHEITYNQESKTIEIQIKKSGTYFANVLDS